LRRAEMGRQGGEGTRDVIVVGDMTLDALKRVVSIRGERVGLTYIEFELLKVMASHPGRVYSRQLLLQLAWGDSDYRDERTIDVHVRHLREKIEADPKNPEYIFTVRNIGYRFRES
jgi:two-component system, OmpR family, response regulator